MNDLAITWKFQSGDRAVWESPHLFGFDVHFGHVVGVHYIPVRTVTRQTPLPQVAKNFITRHVSQWSCDQYHHLAWAVEEASRE